MIKIRVNTQNAQCSSETAELKKNKEIGSKLLYVRQLYNNALVEYFVFRKLFLECDSFFLGHKLFKVGGDCIEKLLKVFLLSHNYDLDIKKEIGHNLSDLRSRCAEINPYFNNQKLEMFCQAYGEKFGTPKTKVYQGHTMFGYSDFPSSFEMETNTEELLDLLDNLNFTLDLIWGPNVPRFELFIVYTGYEIFHGPNVKLFKEKQTVYLSKNKSAHQIYMISKPLIDFVLETRYSRINDGKYALSHPNPYKRV